MGKFYSKEEIEFLKENAEKFGADICAQKLNRPLQGIISKINRLGLKIVRKIDIPKEEIENLKFISTFNNLDINFNTSKNPKELSYFLGFLWADGYVYNNEIKIEIAKEDGIDLKHIFMKLADFTIYNRTREDRKPQMTFYYRDANIANLLKSLGKYPNSIESHEKILDYIPKEYHIWFLRGLIDGDGCFYIHSNKNTISRQFSITASLNFDWSFLKTILDSMGLHCTIQKSETISGNTSRIRCSNSAEIKKFIEVLYKDLDKLYLARKYNKAMMLYN